MHTPHPPTGSRRSPSPAWYPAPQRAGRRVCGSPDDDLAPADRENV